MKRFIAYLIMILGIAGISAQSYAAKDEEITQGKRIVVLGDSYVRNHRRPWSESWHSMAAEKLGMYYLNFGRNGSSIAFDRTKDGFGPAMTERYLTMPREADYILLIAGHNDAEIVGRDASKMDAFKAGLERLLSGLKKRYPAVKIGYVLPWHVDRPGFSEVIAEIEQCCAKYSIPVFDPGKECSINVNDAEFRAKYFQNKGVNDTAHLNAEGHALIVDKGIAFIKSL